jgi:hypothetical protein
MSRTKSCAAFAAVLSVALVMSLAGAPTAQADRCNPDEMIGQVTGQPYEPVFGHDDGPFCYVMRTVVYPAIGCDPVNQSLVQCLQSQPARVGAIYRGLCLETLSEVGDAYGGTVPYSVRQQLQFVFESFEIRCGSPTS